MVDVAVVGGGPAGLAAAIAARMRGFSVTVTDCAKPPIDKTCGEGLMPDSIAALRELGVEIGPSAGAYPFRGIRFLGASASVETGFPSGSGLGVRRTALHRILIERALQLGVRMIWGQRVSGLPEARWVIGADGQNSRVRKWAGLEECASESRRYGFRKHYRVEPWTDCMEIYWAAGCQMYVTPVGTDEVCVVLISRDSHLRFAAAEARFPRLLERLSHASAVTAEKGAVSPSLRLKRVAAGNVALIGDAAGSVDAITGAGLCLAFRQAVQLAATMSGGDLEPYCVWHRRAMRRPAFMAELMLTLDRAPLLREPALSVLQAWPGLFARMLAMHVSPAAWWAGEARCSVPQF